MIEEHAPTRLSPAAAERAVESLRKGLPPVGLVRHFTVGRGEELRALEASLGHPMDDRGSALLIRANYGAGKSHLLQVIREMALSSGYAVSTVTVEAQGGVRFNRMDTVFGAVCRGIDVPGSSGHGVGALMDAFANHDGRGLDARIVRTRAQISDDGSWSFSERLGSPAMFVGLRAWCTSRDRARRDVVEDWLSFPDRYASSRRDLYGTLVQYPDRPFREHRPEKWFYRDGIFSFGGSGHAQSWSGLADLHLLARCSGLKGLVLLFDEFEDVVQNLNNRDWQQKAFHNLFAFFSGDRFPGMAYFAVTPEFVRICKQELLARDVYMFPYEKFDSLPHFEMSKIRKREFRDLAGRIRDLHARAYDWDAAAFVPDEEVSQVTDRLFRRSSQDQIRQAIRDMVEHFDDALETADS